MCLDVGKFNFKLEPETLGNINIPLVSSAPRSVAVVISHVVRVCSGRAVRKVARLQQREGCVGYIDQHWLPWERDMTDTYCDVASVYILSRVLLQSSGVVRITATGSTAVSLTAAPPCT